MKIIFVIGGLQVGGTETHLLQLATHLQKHHYLPIIYSLTGNGPLKEAFTKQGIQVVEGNRWSKQFFWMIPKVRAALMQCLNVMQLTLFLLKNKTAFLHAFLPNACAVSGMAVWFSRHKIFLTSRRSLNHYQKHNKIQTFFEKCAMHRSNKVLGNSKAVLNNLISEGISQTKLGLIYNGIDFEALTVTKDPLVLRHQENIDPNNLVFLIAANLIPYKGHLDLLQALVMAKAKLPQSWVLLCAGTGGHQTVLEEFARRHGIEFHIKFLGTRHDMANLWHMADIGLLVSHEEGFSNSLLEGMYSGTPMIATTVGGNVEAIENGKTGILVPPRNPQALAEAIVALAVDAELRHQLGEAAKQHVRERYSIENCVSAYDEVYQELGTSPKFRVMG